VWEGFLGFDPADMGTRLQKWQLDLQICPGVAVEITKINPGIDRYLWCGMAPGYGIASSPTHSSDVSRPKAEGG
jgi:hypothetical protein